MRKWKLRVAVTVLEAAWSWVGSTNSTPVRTEAAVNTDPEEKGEKENISEIDILRFLSNNNTALECAHFSVRKWFIFYGEVGNFPTSLFLQKLFP